LKSSGLAGKFDEFSQEDIPLSNKEFSEIKNLTFLLLIIDGGVGIEYLFDIKIEDELDDLVMSIPESLCSVKE